MQISDVIHFINPFGDKLSAIFVVLLISLSIATVVWLLASANSENWEKNWNGENLEGSASLNSENGSVQELSEAVATKAEQVADIMPGMLLIIGLLGTFVGLGIALNSASDVLASANISGMDTAMDNLMKLMEGLGAKFKTSTWGLLCFILLNILFNALGFKERRLAWTIQKVRQEANIKNAEKTKLEQDRYNELLDSILNFNNNAQENSLAYQELLNKNVQVQFDGLKANLDAVRAFEQQSRNHHLALIDDLKLRNGQIIETLTQGFDKQIAQLQNDSQNQIDELKNIILANKALEVLSQKNNESLINSLSSQNDYVIKTLNQGFEKHIKQIRTDSQQHIGELQNIVNSNKAIQKASEITTAELKTVVTSLTSGFEENSKQLQDGSNKSLAELKKIADYNQQTQQAMQDFVDKTVASMSSIGESADKMGESAKAVGESANDLNIVVQTLKSELTSVMSDVKTDLGDVMGTIKTDLGDTITTMGDNFKDNISNMSHSIQSNMEQMSSSMSNATKGIEGAVSDLSDNVGKTMNDVTATIGKSMELQQKSANEFTITSNMLNGQIVEMTNLVQQLSGDITSSLGSVAEIGNRMHRIGKNLEGFEGFFAILSETNPKMLEQLEKIADNNQSAQQGLNQVLRELGNAKETE